MKRRLINPITGYALFLAGLVFFAALLFVAPWSQSALVYSTDDGFAIASTTPPTPPEPPKPKHIETPESVKAIYMSSWVAGTPSVREGLIKLAEETEINAIMIDVKDYTGRISFAVNDPALARYGSADPTRIKDIDALIAELHEKNIYIIARIAVFQDDFLARKRPDLAVKRASTGNIWLDHKKIAWLDTSAPEVWDYSFLVAQEAVKRGFDEINLDYIRFPSDGAVSDTSYPYYRPSEESKAEAVRRYYAYIGERKEELGVPVSGDLFGMVLTETSDMNIGQILENGLEYFDYVAPMIYPSHYPDGFNGWKKPATVPYELAKYVLDAGVVRSVAASTTPEKIRPWLQDFDLGADYTAEMVRAQIKATYDAGLDSWMLWAPSNKYTRAALLTP